MFSDWLQSALWIGSTVVVIACVIGGLESLFPLLVGGAVIYALFYIAKGFAQADQNRD
jgi:ABC-type branched-subunit amino acid transport system permease subunit